MRILYYIPSGSTIAAVYSARYISDKQCGVFYLLDGKHAIELYDLDEEEWDIIVQVLYHSGSLDVRHSNHCEVLLD